ncbi:hypothetical protein Tco_1135254 [Tanacetum coccineum]
MSEEDFAKRMVDLNQGTWKLSQLKKLKFEEIKEEFDKLVKQVDTFVPMSLKATKAELKRFGEELQTKTAKRLKIGDKDAQSTKEKEKESVKKMGKRRKQIVRKGLHTAKDEAEKDEASKGSIDVFFRCLENAGVALEVNICWKLVNYRGREKGLVLLTTTQQMVISSPCLIGIRTG